MSMTIELDLDRVTINHYTKYLGHWSRHSIVIVRTHKPDRVLYLDH